jgi:hypothetical protein
MTPHDIVGYSLGALCLSIAILTLCVGIGFLIHVIRGGKP